MTFRARCPPSAPTTACCCAAPWNGPKAAPAPWPCAWTPRAPSANHVATQRPGCSTGGFDEALARHIDVQAQGLDERSSLALLMIDVDHFKALNDRDGHARGDQTLVLLAQMLQRNSRPQDQAARLGGDEFALFAQMTAYNARLVAERVREALRSESSARWPDCPPLTLSIGIGMPSA